MKKMTLLHAGANSGFTPMHTLLEIPLKTIILPTLGAVALMFLAGCADDTTTPTSSTTTTTTEETTSSAMPTPEMPPGTTTTETTETHTVAPASAPAP